MRSNWLFDTDPTTGHLNQHVDQVLSDDQNQNYMRSMISIFKQARVFVGKFAPHLILFDIMRSICFLVLFRLSCYGF